MKNFKKLFKSERAIQDYIVTDGIAENSNEMKFVRTLEDAEEVSVYAKLPKTFQIPTPVGNYSPDWAIAFKDGYGIKHIYFVAETKGSMGSLELRGIEKAKTECADVLFNKLQLGEGVRYGIVTSYQELLDILK